MARPRCHRYRRVVGCKRSLRPYCTVPGRGGRPLATVCLPLSPHIPMYAASDMPISSPGAPHLRSKQRERDGQPYLLNSGDAAVPSHRSPAGVSSSAPVIHTGAPTIPSRRQEPRPGGTSHDGGPFEAPGSNLAGRGTKPHPPTRSSPCGPMSLMHRPQTTARPRNSSKRS